MEQPLISIIVPVYNAEPYLDNCLDSIAAQTWENLEVWLVDDGSTDASPALCDARAAADPRFHVLHQANAGVSAARNAALERATGRYLQFVDGDDYLPSTATERLVRTAGATGADLVIGRFWRVAGTRKALQGHIRRDGVFTRREFAEEMLKAPANFYYGVLWNKLYRRSIVEPAVRSGGELVRGFPLQPGVHPPDPADRRHRPAGLLLCEAAGQPGGHPGHPGPDGGDEAHHVCRLQAALSGPGPL